MLDLSANAGPPGMEPAVLRRGRHAMRLQDVMSTEVATVRADEPVARARALMSERRIHQLVVMDGQDVVGVISNHDTSLRKGTTVQEAMTPSPLVVGPRTTMRQAANLMRGRRIGSLPVVDKDR